VVAIQLRLDRTFGDGPITIEIRGAFIVPQISALQPDGDIVVACIGILNTYVKEKTAEAAADAA